MFSNIKRFFLTTFCLMLFTMSFAQGSRVECEDTCRHIHGIDLSHYQGTVFWETVGKTKMAYVYLKASEGGSRIDSKYKQNIDLAHSYGLKVGSYHFYRPERRVSRLPLEVSRARRESLPAAPARLHGHQLLQRQPPRTARRLQAHDRPILLTAARAHRWQRVYPMAIHGQRPPRRYQRLRRQKPVHGKAQAQGDKIQTQITFYIREN